MHRGEHQPARDGGVRRERERFGLLDLVDENGFRITVQHEPERRREAEPGQLVDLSCLTPSTLYAMGSSTEERLRSGVFIDRIVA